MKRLMFILLILVMGTSTVPAQTHSQSDEQAKIESAKSAAPASVSANATIMDWDGTILEEGTNEWRCYPSMPDAPAENPMCLDDQWIKWFEAYVNKEKPNVTEIGMGYSLQGGAPNSNLDPFANGPTPDNQWMDEVEPHVMILLPDSDSYEDLSTDPDNGGPWVMWPETPYTHIMMPAAELK